MNHFTREELWDLQQRAEEEQKHVSNPVWIRCYEQFIHAISTLDAFIARSSVPAAMFPTEQLVTSAIKALETPKEQS